MELNQKEYDGVTFRASRLANFVFCKRMVKALQDHVPGYPMHRRLRFAARIELEVLMDAIALDPTWRVHRDGVTQAVIDGDGLYVFVYASRKAEYRRLAAC